jgi:hypothetical protein
MTNIETNVVKPEISFMENEIVNLVINNDVESNLDSIIKSIEKFMSDNTGKGKSDSEKDQLYKTSQELWKEYAIKLRDSKYNFHLNRPQYKFLTDLILTKLEYDVNTVFFAIELTDMLGGMKNVKYSNDTDLVAFPVNATEITYIYHLISKHNVKGLSKDAYTFAQILKRIGSISKVFNYYDNCGKTLSTDIQDWVSSFEEGVIVEKRSEEVIEAQVKLPKKKAEAE